MLAYRATAELKSGLHDAAMADCQTLAESYSMDAETYYLTGCVALAMVLRGGFFKLYGSLWRRCHL